MIGERIKEERKRLDVTQSDLAELVGVTRSAVVDWEKDKSSPSARQLVACEKFGFDVLFLITGKRFDKSVANVTTPELSNLIQKVEIPYFSVEASAGYGVYPADETYEESFYVSPDVFMRDLKYVPKNVSIIRVRGDSMTGLLNDGDRIVIDHDRTELQEGIFVIRIDNEILVKRIQRLPGRMINVVSSNPDYAPFSISLDNPPDDFVIIGRVIMTCKMV